MDLSSSGRRFTCFLLSFLVVCSSAVRVTAEFVPDAGHAGQSQVCDNVLPGISTKCLLSPDFTQTQDEEDYRVSGDIFIIHTSVVHLDGNIEKVLLSSLRKHGQVIVKLSGNSISIVKDAAALRGLLHNAKQTSGDIAKDLLDVLYICEKKSHIYIFTDRVKEITNEADLVLQTLRATPIRVDIITVSSDSSEYHSHRERRQAQMNFYQLLANLSGGSVINTDKDHIASAVDIIKQSLQTAMVTLMKFSSSDPAGQLYQFAVDDTMTQLTIQVQVEKTMPVMMATMPNGIPCPVRPRTLGSAAAGSVVSLLEYNLTSAAEYGMWKLMKATADVWDLGIKGNSPVDFTHEFVEPGPGGFGEYPIKGRPIAGASYKLVITVPEYAKMQSINLVFLMFRDQFVPSRFFGLLTNVGGRRGKSMFYTNITIPDRDFMIAVEGKDKTGHAFRRLDPMLVLPISFRLYVPSMGAVKLYVNESVSIPYTVSNAGAGEIDVVVKIEDDQMFTTDPKFKSHTLKVGENGTGIYIITAGSVAGVTSTVTITASLGPLAQGQYEIRRFTVVERPKKPEDKIDPTCNVTAITGTCNIGSDLCECLKQTWSMDIEIGDDGFGVREVFPVAAGDNSTYTFTHDNFTKGHNTSMGVIKASFSADCCHQGASIQVVDMAGNTGQCQANITKNFVPPDPKLCNNSTLNVTLPCKDIQMSSVRTCNFGSNPCDCDTVGWHMRVEFDTVGYNITQAFTVGAGNNGSLVRNGNVVEFDSDCCHQQITINALDIAGNVGQCNVTLSNFTLPSQCTTTTMTTTTASTTTTAATSTSTQMSSSVTSSANTGSSSFSTTTVGNTTSPSPGQTPTGSSQPASQTSSNSVTTNIPTGTPASGVSSSPSPTHTPSPSGGGGVKTGGPVTKSTSPPGKPAPNPQPAPSGGKSASSSTPTSYSSSQSTNPPGGSTAFASTNKQAAQTNTDDSKGSSVTGTAVGIGIAVGAVFGLVVESHAPVNGVPDQLRVFRITSCVEKLSQSRNNNSALSALLAMTVLFRKALTKAQKSVSPERQRKPSHSAWS